MEIYINMSARYIYMIKTKSNFIVFIIEYFYSCFDLIK